MRVAMAVFGIILLLPGVCALYFMVGSQFDTSMIGLWFICFFISAAGVLLLLYAAIGGRGRNNRPNSP